MAGFSYAIRWLLGAAAVCAVSTAMAFGDAGAGTAASAKLSAEQLVRDWATAWDRGDVERYLSCYASDFVPASGLTRERWQAQRRERLQSGPRYVILRDIQIDLAGATAVAHFTQHYLDMHLIGTASKSLLLFRYGDAWKIRAERVEAETQARR